jgi:aminopeptidase YwaD
MYLRIAIPLVLVTTLLAEQPVCRAQSRSERKEIKQLQTDVAYLASDEMDGRRTGTQGAKKAADYIEQRYKEEGIDPYKNQYEYPFKFVYGEDISEATQVKIGNNLLHMPEEGFPLSYSASKKVYDDNILPDVMEQDNIWMIALYSEQADADDPHFDAKKWMYDKSMEAEKQGATAVIFYDGFGSKWAPAYTGRGDYKSLTIPVVFLSHDAYVKYVQQSNASDAYTRDEKAGLPIDINIALKPANRTGTNIAAYIDNNAPYTVVIGAHFDHLGHGEDGNGLYTGRDHPIYSGADDNASGTAALLEVAAWLKKSRLHNYNYLFINFSGEELGLLGSKAFVKEQKMDGAHIAYMINMDMIGRLNDTTHALTVGGTGTSPIWKTIITEPDKEFKIIEDSTGALPSDHMSFYHAGIPVLFFYTGMQPDYHRPGDKADKINYNGEEEVIKYVHSVLVKMDKVPKPSLASE